MIVPVKYELNKWENNVVSDYKDGCMFNFIIRERLADKHIYTYFYFRSKKLLL